MADKHYLSVGEAVMKQYPLVRSTLEGIFGAQVGLDDDESAAVLLRDLSHLPFKEGIQKELSAAMTDATLSWQTLLDESDVEYFDTEDQARNFVNEKLIQVVFRSG